MSSAQGYADRLSNYDRKGTLNLLEDAESALTILHKARHLVTKLKASTHAVIHTGAGISTNAGIPDFRGPTGIWTEEFQTAASKKKRHSNPVISFEDAVPTLTHAAITALRKSNHIHYVISQNVDGLHTRAGFPREHLSELHGNLFVDWCATCRREYARASEATSVGFSPTGRTCVCGSVLTDKALDWEDELPEPDFGRACEQARVADLHVVVGTSCQMQPARGLPFGGRACKRNIVLVNLSRTEFDSRFGMVIRSDCDSVFALVVSGLGVRVQDFQRVVRVVFEAAGISGRVRCMMRLQRDECVVERRVLGVTGVRYRGVGTAWRECVTGVGYLDWVDDCEAIETEVVVNGGGEGACCGMRVEVNSVDECEMDLVTFCTEFETNVAEIGKRVKEKAATVGGLGDVAVAEMVEVADLFVSGGRKGYAMCVVCGEEVWSGRGVRDKHFAKCLQGQEV